MSSLANPRHEAPTLDGSRVLAAVALWFEELLIRALSRALDNEEIQDRLAARLAGKMALASRSPEDTFTTQAAAEYLCIHQDTVRRYVSLGRLKAAKVGAKNLYRRVDLDALKKEPA